MIDEEKLLGWLKKRAREDNARSRSSESRGDKEYWFGRAGAFLEIHWYVVGILEAGRAHRKGPGRVGQAAHQEGGKSA